MQEKWLSNKKQGPTTINKSGILPEYTGEGTYVGYWKLMLGTNKLTFCSRVRKMLELPRTKENGLWAILKLMPPTQRRSIIFEVQQACLNGANFEKQVKLVTPKGKVKWIRITGILYYRRWGKAEQMIGAIEDMTQKVTEESMSLAIVNHELRAPLTIIKLNIQMLINQLSGTLNKNPVKLLTNVDLHIDSMTKVMEEYLNSSQDDQRVRQLNLTVFDIHELIDIVVGEMKTIHSSYRFYRDLSEPVCVRADKYQIIQVLINYITNAVNFSPTCSHIKVKTSFVNDQIEVSVHDQGISIPCGQEQQVFQKFYRCDQKAVRQKNSKGLGLYLVKKIIQDHEGSVRAERGSEGGSVFYFTLPVFEDKKLEKPTYAVANSRY
jgi:two-component system sensor histidine kinase VicK